MLLPFSTVCPRILIPVGAAEQVWESVAIHVEQGDTLGVIAAESMSEKGNSRLAARAVSGVLHAKLCSVSWILTVTWNRGKKGQNQQRGKVLGC